MFELADYLLSLNLNSNLGYEFSWSLWFPNSQFDVGYKFAGSLWCPNSQFDVGYEFAGSLWCPNSQSDVEYKFAGSLGCPNLHSDVGYEFARSLWCPNSQFDARHEFARSLYHPNSQIMSITKEQQQALDEAFVLKEQRLTIGSCNYRLSIAFKPKEATFQVALNVLSLAPFYPDFLITASVPAVYMQELWTTVTYQKHHIRFKINKKSYSFDLDTFRNMLQMCLKLPGQKFVDPLFEKDILTFMRELGYSSNIKFLSDVKVDTLPQPWRKFGTLINKCLSGKVTGIDTLFSTHDDDARQEEEVNEEESFDPIVQTPSQVENTDDEDNDDDSHGMNVEGDELDDEGANEKDDGNELYRDVNINLEGQDIQMADVQTIQVIKDTHVTLTLVNLEDVSITTTAETPLLFATTLLPPSTPIIPHLQQTHVPSPENVPSSSLQDLPNFGSLFGFDHKLKTLEVNFLEFMQTNQFTKAISLIPGIVDKYIDNQMNEAVKVAVQLQSDRLRDEAQYENEDFLNKLDEKIQKIIKEQVKAQISKILPYIEKTINEQLEAEVLTRLSNSSKTSYAIAANLSELELKKILFNKMESNKSIHRFDEQKNLYKALVDGYECDKLILDTYGDTVNLKRCRDDEDTDEEPSAGSNRGSKKRRARKEQESTSAPKEKTSKTSGKSSEGSKSHHKSDSESAQKDDSRTSFNELMDTPLDFSAFVMNQLKVDTLSPELLAGSTYELMKVSCKSLVELEFFLEEVYKATTDQLDWNNPEGQQYPHDLQKPLPLIPTSRGHRVIPFDHFINNDLEYLRGGVSSQKYTTLVTKQRLQIMGTLNGLKIWYLEQCGVKCQLAMTNMHFGESHFGGENDNNSMDLGLTGNLLEMYTPNAKSSLS
nr:hypothetical protein [Tanacetum cinerariifolium]